MWKNLKNLQADPTIKLVSTRAPFVSFRTAHKLRSHLFRSKLYPFAMNHYFDCNSESGIYLISCKVSSKKYGGSTTEKFRFRWNNYMSCQWKDERREDCMQRYLHERRENCMQRHLHERREHYMQRYLHERRENCMQRYLHERKEDCMQMYLHERREDCMQRYLHEHVLSQFHNGLIYDVNFFFFNKTDPSDLTRKEEFWRAKLKTLAPYGFNVKE